MGRQEFNPSESFRVRQGDSLHPVFLKDVGATGTRIIAEGDSWFNFPGSIPWEYWDLLEVLNRRGRNIVSFAHWGHILDDMVHGGLDNYGRIRNPGMDDVIPALRASRSKVFLVSGGGNDLVGDELRVLLNHKNSGRELLRLSVAEYVINDYLKGLYQSLANRIWCEVDEEIRIVTHGYANARPTGKKAFGLNGPWLKESFLRAGISYEEGEAVVGQLIDMFNNMLVCLSRSDDRIFHVDFRECGVGDSLDHWDDEMHLDTAPLEVAGDMLDAKIEEALGNSSREP